LLNPGTVILELSDPILQRDVVDSEFQLKGAEADYANLKVQVDSDLMNQKPTKPRCAAITSKPACNMTWTKSCTKRASALTTRGISLK